MVRNTRNCLIWQLGPLALLAPGDDQNMVHMYAVVRETIKFSHGTKNSVWGMISNLTCIKLNKRNVIGKSEVFLRLSVRE